MNDENLKPINERADFIELSRKGGINSGIARRRAKAERQWRDIVISVVLEDMEKDHPERKRKRGRPKKIRFY